MKLFISIFLSFLIFSFMSCTTTIGIDKFYDSYWKEENLQYLNLLEEGEEPLVLETSDIEGDIIALKSDYYTILGYSGWNGPAKENLNEAVKQLCIKKKAKIGIYAYHYTDTRYGTYYVYGGGYVPYNIKRYDYDVYLFAEYPDSMKEHLQKEQFEVKNLDSKSRYRLHRNTGAVIDIVYNDTKAFYANLIKDDVLIEINGTPIQGIYDYYIYKKEHPNEASYNLKVVRNGQIIEINY